MTPEPGRFAEFVFGIHPVREFLRHLPWLVDEVLADPVSRRRLRPLQVLAHRNGVSFRWIPRKDLDRLAHQRRHQGIVARVTRYPYVDYGEVLDQCTKLTGVLVALDSIEDPQNVGAVVRSAAFFGATGIVLPRRRACQVTPAVARVSAGALAHVHMSVVTNLARALDKARNAGALVVGAVAKEGIPLHRVEVPQGQAVVMVVGSEHRGLRRVVAERCEILATVPCTGDLDSLNVGVAAGIFLYHFLGRRER